MLLATSRRRLSSTGSPITLFYMHTESPTTQLFTKSPNNKVADGVASIAAADTPGANTSSTNAVVHGVTINALAYTDVTADANAYASANNAVAHGAIYNAVT